MNWLQKNLDSRRVFVNTLEGLDDPRNILVTCDVGFNYLDDTKLKVFNLGVTEASSMVIASGLALSGYTVWFYSMINFSLFRPYEMVRNAVVKHNASVKIIGVKGGPAYKMLGFSHNLLHEDEDIKLCENIGLRSHVVQSPEQTRDIIMIEYGTPGPAYIRL